MIEPRCLTEGRVGHLCFRTASSAMEKGFVAPGCIPTMRGEGVGGFRSMASLPARRRLQLQPLLLVRGAFACPAIHPLSRPLPAAPCIVRAQKHSSRTTIYNAGRAAAFPSALRLATSRIAFSRSFAVISGATSRTNSAR
jgi:hypothetical protein